MNLYRQLNVDEYLQFLFIHDDKSKLGRAQMNKTKRIQVFKILNCNEKNWKI